MKKREYYHCESALANEGEGRWSDEENPNSLWSWHRSKTDEHDGETKESDRKYSMVKEESQQRWGEYDLSLISVSVGLLSFQCVVRVCLTESVICFDNSSNRSFRCPTELIDDDFYYFCNFAF